jgi:NTE family protein
MAMVGKDKAEIPERGGKTDTKKSVDYKYHVSEGSNVILDARDFLPTDETNIESSYSWDPKKGTTLPIGARKENSTLSFTAPYVKGNTVTNSLSFELTFKDKSGKTRGPYTVNVVIKRVQRAMIFQGGVALGAYEAGAYDAIVEKLVNIEDKKREVLGSEKRPLFDIVAGTSIGGMNGAIIVSSVTDGKSLEDTKNWEDSTEEVMEFWRAQQQWPTFADGLDMFPLYQGWWNILHKTSEVNKKSATELMESYSNTSPELRKWYDNALANWSLVDPSFWQDYLIDGWYIPATAEAARRYYSTKQYLFTTGNWNVTTGVLDFPRSFGKFFDFFEPSNYLPRPDNKHYVLFSLKKTLERFAHFPITTKEGQPRFLLVTVDARTGDAVTFDSYAEQAKYHDDTMSIHNQNGVEIDHALATGTFPDFFDYPKFKVNNSEMGVTNEEHIFWDGGFRSNTPLREVIQAHRDYWYKTRKSTREEKEDEDCENATSVPDLEVYIADLWPSETKEDPVSFDLDFVAARKWDLLLGDKTDYDEQVANVVTDYVDLARQLKNLAQRKGASDEEISHILNQYATSMNTKGQVRKFQELLGGRFRLTKVTRIDHKDDGSDVGVKVFDYSYKTIERLTKDGRRDAYIAIDMQLVEDRLVDLVKRDGHGSTAKVSHSMEKLQESFHRIQDNTMIEGRYDIIISEVDRFISEVDSMPEKSKYGLSLGEEKSLLIEAAKQFRNTVEEAKSKSYTTALSWFPMLRGRPF